MNHRSPLLARRILPLVHAIVLNRRYAPTDRKSTSFLFHCGDQILGT